MKLDTKKIKSFESYDSIRSELLTKKEIELQDKIVALEVQVLKEIQESVSAEVASYMAKENIGFNEFTRRMNISSRQSSRIMSGKANLTLATIAEVAALMGKKARVTFI